MVRLARTQRFLLPSTARSAFSALSFVIGPLRVRGSLFLVGPLTNSGFSPVNRLALQNRFLSDYSARSAYYVSLTRTAAL